MNVVAISGKEYEVIFDPIAKSAILRNEETLLWLDGPFRSYAEAVSYAVNRLENRGASGVASVKIRSH
jgi:hypothetical protein